MCIYIYLLMWFQITMNPRRLAGFGLSDGEWTERIWSYLGRFSHIVKEQTAANHNDLLTAAALYLAQKKADYLGIYFYFLDHRNTQYISIWSVCDIFVLDSLCSKHTQK